MASHVGIVVADKPAGLTSHDVVARARRALGMRRVGHAGTLDPFATGALVVLVGRATRLARFFGALPKTYEVVARLGARSSTGDPEGEIVETGNVPQALVLPRGVVRQRPPAYSAVKVDGERAYRRARRGEPVETAEREVVVHQAAQLWRQGALVGLRFVCSSGTYVRTLVETLGGDAYCVELRRLAIGPFEAAGGWPAQGPADVVGVAAAWARFGTVLTLDAARAGAVVHGRAVPADGVDGPVLLVDAAGEPLAVASGCDGMLRVEVGLRG
jgi:tRNA pseudouridine55 synthase